ncbi:hypothetical protein ACLB2K_041871 [Fragaria x ananassa]
MDWQDNSAVVDDKILVVNENFAAFGESLAAIQRGIDEMMATIRKQQVEQVVAKESAEPAHVGHQGWRGSFLPLARLANLMFTSEMTQSASPNRGHDKLNYIWFGDIPKSIRSFIFQYDWSLSMQVQRPEDGFSDFYFTLVCSRSLAASKHDGYRFPISASEAEADSLGCDDFIFDFDIAPIYDEYDEDYMLTNAEGMQANAREEQANAFEVQVQGA